MRTAADEHSAYSDRLNQQIQQYADDPTAMHVKPPSFHYWSQNYIAPRMQNVFGTIYVHDIFIDRLTATNERPKHLHFASLGSGSASIEISVAKGLLARGFTDFSIDLYELSNILLAEAKKCIDEENLASHFNILETDINNSRLVRSYNGIIAHHSLHHFVNLEGIFDDVKARLIGDANFVTYDVVGRNGHMRWPEVLTVVEKIWAMLPKSKKYNHQLKATWDEFVNWDCSGSGFEGIRAQDIMPNLLNRFNFSHFVAFGGLTEVFFDLAFGRNFDPSSDLDRGLIDFVEYLNKLLIDAGAIKPTIIFASMGNVPVSCKCDRHLTPHFCLRNPT